MLKKIATFFCILLFICTTVAYAEGLEGVELKLTEKSEEFKKWENLLPKERENVIQPYYSNIDIKDSIKRSKYNQLLSQVGSATVDSQYNLKNRISNIKVKNQQLTGACWAFSFTSALETTLANKYNTTSVEYSPMHIDYKTAQMFKRNLGAGGNSTLALAYSVGLNGPVYESDLPFDSVYNQSENSQENYYLKDASSVDLNKPVRARVEDATLFATINKKIAGSEITYTDGLGKTYTQEEVNAIRTLIKSHIKEDGGVTANVYSDMSVTDDGQYTSKAGYYDTTHHAYYCNNEALVVNHAITIVGWDDTFSKDYFAEGKRPLHDGAYIALNSYGTGLGDGGYFYISYDDIFVEQMMMGINSVEEYDDNQSKSDYDYIYQYDELGMSVGVPLNRTNMYLANVYNRQDKQNLEQLTEVGLFLYATQGVEIYVNPNGDNMTNLGTPVASYTGSNALEAGYHTVKLSSPVQLTGDKFAVVVKYINTENVTIPLECDLVESGITQASNYWDNATSSANQSYISVDGSSWSDMYNLSLQPYTLKNTNACIKAFTTKSQAPAVVQATGVKLNKTTHQMQVGDQANLVATITPENATNKNVDWTSSDENVATITPSGVITAKNKGETTITVTTQDGGYTATCKLTVVAKTNSDDDIYSGTGGSKGNQGTTTSLDKTTSSKGLPYTGSAIMLTLLVITLVIGIVVYIRYRSFDDVK